MPPGDGPIAVVPAMDCITGLQTARILAHRGVPVIGVVADRHHFCARTRVISGLVESPTAGEPLIEHLERLATRLDGRAAVLLPCSDASVLAISRWRDRLAGAYRFVLPEHDTVEMLMDKVRFAEYATAAGLPIPATRILRSADDARAAAAELTFPVVLKPSVKSDRWFSATKAKALRIADADDLLSAYERWSAASDVLIAQRWIEGGESSLVSVNLYLDRTCTARVVFVARKLRQWPPDTGTSSLGEEVRDDAVREIAIRMFEDVGFKGLAYLEMKIDSRTGERLIVEPNIGRPTGRSAIAEQGGVELVYSAFLDALGEPLPGDTEQRYTGARWIYWRHDLQAAAVQMMAGRLTPAAWWRSVRGPKWEAVFDPGDPRPFVIDILDSVGKTGRVIRSRVSRA
jgi:D-aspartate ligase